MNFSQLHEGLRLELSRRIERGVLTGTLLARQTGLRPAHISNFLNRKRRLSLSALDRVLAAQMLSIDDLLPERRASSISALLPGPASYDAIPLIAQYAAIVSRHITPNAVQELIRVPAGYLEQLEAHRSTSRQNWQRFVAIRAASLQARPMMPVIRTGAILIIDRHYNSLKDLHPPHPNVYAVRIGNVITLRYVAFDADRLILRPHALEYPVELLELNSREGPSDLIVGRICIIISEV